MKTVDEIRDEIDAQNSIRKITLTDFSKATMSDVIFDDLLRHASFRKSTITTCDFSGGFLVGLLNHSTFEKAQITQTDFSGAEACFADFRKATIRSCDFGGADLTSASFKNAILNDVSFREATLRGADFSGVDLSRVEGLTEAQLATAIIDERTVLPDRFDAEVMSRVLLKSARQALQIEEVTRP